MTIRLYSLALLAGLALTPVLSAQSYVTYPGVYSFTDVTPDGSIVVGSGTGGACYWRWQVDPAPTYIGGQYAAGVSDDGTAIIGSITDPVLNKSVAARWTAATGWQSLGYLPNALTGCGSMSSAYDISGDGSTVVGLSWDGCSGRGFRWTQAGGMQELMNLGNGQNRASAISGDGSAIGGFAQGSFSRTPAYWNPDTTGFMIDFDGLGEVNGFTDNGAWSVGTWYFGSGNFYGAFVRNAATGVMTELGALNPATMSGIATDISEDLGTIVGYDSYQLSREAWVWTSADGIISLQDRLGALGVASVPTLYTCSAVSDDGHVIVGSGAPGFNTGYIANLDPNAGGWVNIGGGAVGINGIPLLAGNGSLAGGMPAGLTLTNARESTLTVAWVSFNPTPVPALGGTIHTLPYNSQFLFNTDPTGSIALNTIWPVGVPPGTQAWFQFLIADSSSIHGIVPSNALRATTP